MLFFFQAEDGIRDLTVTGVQTCALPIFRRQGRTQDLPDARVEAFEAGHFRGIARENLPDPALALRVLCGRLAAGERRRQRSEEHTSELQSQSNLVCRLLLEKKKNNKKRWI